MLEAFIFKFCMGSYILKKKKKTNYKLKLIHLKVLEFVLLKDSEL